MKKRNCRKTDLEREQHDRAIRIRKMTDSQLCEYMDALQNAAAGTEHPEEEHRKAEAEILADCLQLLDDRCGSGNGIGRSTVIKLRRFFTQEGMLNGV